MKLSQFLGDEVADELQDAEEKSMNKELECYHAWMDVFIAISTSKNIHIETKALLSEAFRQMVNFTRELYLVHPLHKEAVGLQIRLQEEGCAATVLVSYWPGKLWFQQRLEALFHEIFIIPWRKALFTSSRLRGSKLATRCFWYLLREDDPVCPARIAKPPATTIATSRGWTEE
ncbi:hypothetical protein CYMTET_5981 [Cymbomonas tetramitiformis]|uniref:Uncharacterized protein n=1 Tax=Cymbomonas tetramitiformis TaxID=36881 RepID=A0AAE0GY28_9CHLO|nr:hypothetical protein CYMTET_5981 [Cymbomonas tetramitiformis]